MPASSLPSFAILWRMFRPHTLTAAFVPVAVGSAYAYWQLQLWHPAMLLVMLLASLLIQAATNMFNEYFDFKRGLDHANSVGISGTIVRDGLQPRMVLYIALACFIIAILLGIFLAAYTTWLLIPIGLCCCLVGYLYSGGPCPISETPFGELVSGLLMGTVIVSISYFLPVGTLSPQVLFISLPIAILIGAILMSNNLRDLDEDQKHGRRTLAILAGRTSAIYILALFFLTAYLSIILLILGHWLPPACLIVCISLPLPWKALHLFRRHTRPNELMAAMAATAQTNTIFGLLLASALLWSAV